MRACVTEKMRWIVLVLAIWCVPTGSKGCTWIGVHAEAGVLERDGGFIDQLTVFRVRGSQPQGWGMVGYLTRNAGRLVRYHSELPSDQDPLFQNMSNQLRERAHRIAIVHNWLRVTGPVGVASPYPHTRHLHGKWYAFGENGVTPMTQLYGALEPGFLAEHPIGIGTDIDSYQMGELWLLLVLQETSARGGDSEAGFISAIKKMGRHINASLIFTDGARLWCYTDNRPIYYFFDPRSGNTVVSSGARGGDTVTWKTIGGSPKLLITRNHQPPVIMPLDE